VQIKAGNFKVFKVLNRFRQISGSLVISSCTPLEVCAQQQRKNYHTYFYFYFVKLSVIARFCKVKKKIAILSE
jgi:hypothetical protein